MRGFAAVDVERPNWLAVLEIGVVMAVSEVSEEVFKFAQAPQAFSEGAFTSVQWLHDHQVLSGCVDTKVESGVTRFAVATRFCPSLAPEESFEEFPAEAKLFSLEPPHNLQKLFL